MWRWAFLLGFALCAPAALPAGGADRRQQEVLRRADGRDPLLSDLGASLHCAPQSSAPLLGELEAGLPLRVLRRWRNAHGEWWHQVQLPGDGLNPAASLRGWIRSSTAG